MTDLDTPGAPGTGAAVQAGLGHILDLPVEIAVRLGSARLTIAEIAALAPGAVVELDRAVGDPVDVLVNDRLVARGELVVVEGRVGVTITAIVA